MDKQKIKSVPRLTTDNPVDNFQTALNFTDVSEDGWVWLRQPEMALTEYMRKLVKGHGSSIDLDCNDMELSETLTEHLFDDPKQSIDGLIAEHYTILWAYATLREKLKWYEDVYIMLAQLVEIVGKPEEVQQIVLEKLEQLKGALDGGEVQSE